MTGITPEDIKLRMAKRHAQPTRFLPLLKLLIAVVVLGFAIWYFQPKVTKLISPTVAVAHTFTTKTGQNFSGVAVGYDKEALALKLFADNSTRYYPIEDLSPADQRFVSTLTGIKIDWPLECTAYDRKGNPVYVNVYGRTTDYAILSDPKTGSIDYRPLSYFSEEDQKVFRMLNASSMPRYSFKMTLTDLSGRSIPVVVSGRTDLDVKIVLANGTATTFPLDKLSLVNQEFLRKLSGEYDSLALHRLHDRNDQLEVDNIKLQAIMAAPNSSATEKEIAQKDYFQNRQEISSNTLKIEAEMKNAALVNNKKSAQGSLP